MLREAQAICSGIFCHFGTVYYFTLRLLLVTSNIETSYPDAIQARTERMGRNCFAPQPIFPGVKPEARSSKLDDAIPTR